jgi:hypothetical protein
MARTTYNLNTLQDLYKKHYYYGDVCLENDDNININQLRRNVIRTNNSRKLSYCVPYNGTLNRHS